MKKPRRRHGEEIATMEEGIIKHNPLNGSELVSDLPEPLLPHAMSVTELADRCMSEVNNYRNREPSNDQYGVELFRRASIHRDPLPCEIVHPHSHPLILPL